MTRIGFTIIQIYVFHLSGWIVLFRGAYCFCLFVLHWAGPFFCFIGGGVFFYY